jgi:hypothetical protein
MLRIHRFDWNFSSTAEIAIGILLTAAILLSLTA